MKLNAAIADKFLVTDRLTEVQKWFYAAVAKRKKRETN
jgi:hypothetical protein